jgi:predicted DNA-binding antitoxin AbrB/MazE fold protein
MEPGDDDMTRSLQAVYEHGVLRLLEPHSLAEHQQVTVTISDQAEDEWLDASFLHYLEPQADDSIDISQVRTALSKISGSMTGDFQLERNERS